MWTKIPEHQVIGNSATGELVPLGNQASAKVSALDTTALEYSISTPQSNKLHNLSKQRESESEERSTSLSNLNFTDLTRNRFTTKLKTKRELTTVTSRTLPDHLVAERYSAYVWGGLLASVWKANQTPPNAALGVLERSVARSKDCDLRSSLDLRT